MSRRSAARRACFSGRPYVDPGEAGPRHEPDRPVFAFDRELGVLERAFYRHLLRAIDLDALFELEQMLWAELQERARLTDPQVLDLSNAILTRALERVSRDPLRSIREGTLGPGGRFVAIPEEPHGNCPFCAYRAREIELAIGTQENVS